MKVLLVAPDPLGGDISPVMAFEEQQAMMEAIAFHHPVELVRLYPPTWRHLRQALIGREGPFDVVHFIGHGYPEGIILEDEFGGVNAISSTELASALSPQGISLVVLNVCTSELPAQTLIQAGIPAVVGTTQEISNQQAITVTQELYGTLASGQPLSEAMHQVTLALEKLGGSAVAEIPICLGKDELRFDPSQTDRSSVRFLNDPNIHYAPAPSAHFGHQHEIQAALHLLTSPDTHLVQIMGISGSGKTSFGTQLVQRGAWRFWGVLWLSLKGQVGSIQADLIAKLTPLLGVGSHNEIIDRLGQIPLLLVFDDPDSLTAEGQEELGSFLEQFPFGSGSKIVFLTSTQVSVPEQVGPLGLIQIHPLNHEDAFLHLLYCVRRKDVTELLNASEQTLLKIIDQLGNHPGLIESAVDLVKVVGLNAALNMLADLPEPYAGKIAALLNPSLRNLSEAETEVLYAASTFDGSFKTEWLTGVSGSTISRDSLLSLVRKGLVLRRGNQYILPTILKYHLAKHHEGDSFYRLRHAQFFAQTVSALAAQSQDTNGFNTRKEFKEILGEVYIGVNRCKEYRTEEANRLIRDLVAGIRDYLHFQRQDWPLIIFFEEAAMTACKDLGEMQALGSVLTSLGSAQAASGKVSTGLSLCLEGIQLLKDSATPYPLSVGYGALGFIHRRQGDIDAAQTAYQTGLALSEEIHNIALQVRHLSNLGTIYRTQKDWDKAEHFYQRALDLARQSDNHYLMASQFDMLGNTARWRGTLEQSTQYHQQAYWLRKQLGDDVGLRLTVTNLASTLKGAGRAEDIIEDLETTLLAFPDKGYRLQRWFLLLQLARLHRALNHLGLARDYYEEALEMAQEDNYLKGISICERGLGKCYELEGDLLQARTHLRKAVDVPSDPSFATTLLEELRRVETALAS